MSLSLESIGSSTSLSQRSQDDELSSINSGQSSVDLQPPDDSERLAMLTSAVTWIKGELAAMRDCDRGILQQLLVAHSTINDIREQHKMAASAGLLNDTQYSSDQHSSNNTLDDIREEFESSGNSQLATSFKKETTPIMDTPLKVSNSTPLKSENDDDILSQFFGRDDVPKFELFKTQESVDSVTNIDEIDKSSSTSNQQPSTAISSKTKAQLKLEAKKEGRSSVAFEMQLLRQQLHEQAKSELAAFDKEFDSNRELPSLLEPETRSYRHSILNRMDELLYPSSQNNDNGGTRTHRSGSHVRQSSEPVIFNDFKTSFDNTYNQRSPSARGNPGNNKGYLSTSQSTHFSSPSSGGGRKGSEPTVTHNSFRMPTSRTYVELNRTGSGYMSHSINKHQKQAPHYDTTVVKKRSSSRNGTLEKTPSKQSLQYSVESLDEDSGDHHSNRIMQHQYSLQDDSLLRDFESPEHKSVTHHRGVISPEVYPELSSRGNNKLMSPPYLQTSNNQIKWGGASGGKLGKKGSSTSGQKKSYLSSSSMGSENSSWL